MVAPTVPKLGPGRTEPGTSPGPTYSRGAKRPSWRRSLRRQLFPVFLILPALALLGLLQGYPIVRLFATSFQDLGLLQLFSHKVVWNGFDNYRTLLSSGQLGTSVAQTVVFVVACVGLTSAAAIVWTWLFSAQYGVINYILSALGFQYNNHDWFGSTISAYSIITANIVWGAVPFVALTMYSAFTLVPRDLFEAAAIDGASPVVMFRKVTMPIVRPIFVLLVVLSVIWDANVFNQVWYLTQGNAQLLNVIPLGVWQYIEAFSSQQYGLGAATAVIMILLLVAVTGYYIRIMVRTGEISGKAKA
jgi:N,N'-diacetylchitobiose transport system permease protein